MWLTIFLPGNNKRVKYPNKESRYYDVVKEIILPDCHTFKNYV